MCVSVCVVYNNNLTDMLIITVRARCVAQACQGNAVDCSRSAMHIGASAGANWTRYRWPPRGMCEPCARAPMSVVDCCGLADAVMLLSLCVCECRGRFWATGVNDITTQSAASRVCVCVNVCMCSASNEYCWPSAVVFGVTRITVD